MTPGEAIDFTLLYRYISFVLKNWAIQILKFGSFA
jgi:hypothetical protein